MVLPRGGLKLSRMSASGELELARTGGHGTMPGYGKYVWEVKTGKELSRFTPGNRNLRDAGIIAMAVSGDGRYLARASNRDFHENYGVQVWDVATARIVGIFAGHSEMVKAVAFTPDGRFVLSGSDDKTIRVWDIATGRETHCLRGHESSVNALAVTPDGCYAISAAGDYSGGELHDPTIRMWELDSGSMVRVFEGHSGLIDDIAVSPDGKLMASVSWDTSLRIWNLSSGEQMQTWQAPRGIFNAVSFSPNGKNLLTGSAYSADGAVQLWDISTGQELRDFGVQTIAHDVAFSPDGKTLVSAQEITRALSRERLAAAAVESITMSGVRGFGPDIWARNRAGTGKHDE
jgi:WD40 repeat protein